MGFLDRVYSRLPVWAQHGAVSAFGLYWHYLRFGPGYRDYVRAYQLRDRWSAAEWTGWQANRLNEILKVAAEKVPHYREVWSAADKAAARAGRLSELPLLEKDPLRRNPAGFSRADIHPAHIQHFATSGSTGTPITASFTLAELRQSLALREVRSAGWAGVSFKEPRATFSGRMVEPDPNSKGPFYRFNLVERQVYFSPFHLRPDTAQDYVEALERHQIKWLTGYAVSFYLLGRFILDGTLSVPPLRALITTSEKTTPEMRSVMEQAFGCRVYEEYSTVENVLFASECEHGRLHVSPDFAVVEILRPNGELCAPDEVGEVVATSLLKTFQPLIRYRLGDLAAWDGQPCPCGRQMPVIKEVVGRIEDVVIGPDGRQMVRFHGVFVNQPHIREGQVIQETLDRIRIKVVPAPGFCQADEDEIVRRVGQRLGPDVSVAVEKVAEIPRSKSGKFQAVISKLNSKQ